MEIEKQLLKKYIAIKVNGINHYIWFKTEDTHVIDNIFNGKGGWGKNGSYTSISCNTCDIKSIIYSEDLQYT